MQNFQEHSKFNITYTYENYIWYQDNIISPMSCNFLRWVSFYRKLYHENYNNIISTCIMAAEQGKYYTLYYNSVQESSYVNTFFLNLVKLINTYS